MKLFYFYSKNDKKKEAISKASQTSRLEAAKEFAAKKRLSLKTFLKIFGVSR
jgi:hypothetical protein